MILYEYDPNTFEFLSATRAQEDPLNRGTYFMRSNSTFTEPPKTTIIEVACFIDNVWVKKPDYRKKVYYDKKTKERVYIKNIGELPTTNLTEIEPIQDYIWSNEQNTWIEDTNLIKQNIVSTISLKRKEVLKKGFKFEKDNNVYYFGVSKNDVGSTSLTVLAFNNDSIAEVNWKCSDNNFVTLNKEEFLDLAVKSTIFANEQFEKESKFLNRLETLNLTSQTIVKNFKREIENWV